MATERETVDVEVYLGTREDSAYGSLGPKYYHNLSCKTWDDFREGLSAHIRKVYLRSCKQDTRICEKLFKDTAANEDAGIQMYGFTRMAATETAIKPTREKCACIYPCTRGHLQERAH